MNKEEYLKDILNKAKEAVSSDKNPIAVELLGPYLAECEDDGLAWYLYGDSLRVVGRFEEAKSALEKALCLTPSNKQYGVQVRLGCLFVDMGCFKEAETWFLKATQSKVGKKKGWIWIHRGTNLVVLNNFDSAEDCYRKALASDDVDIEEAYLNLGYLFIAQRKFQEAMEELNKALKVDPEYSEAIEALKSIQDIEEFIELAKNIPCEERSDVGLTNGLEGLEWVTLGSLLVMDL